MLGNGAFALFRFDLESVPKSSRPGHARLGRSRRATADFGLFTVRSPSVDGLLGENRGETVSPSPDRAALGVFGRLDAFAVSTAKVDPSKVSACPSI
jgi:hypothetical protein